MNTTNPITSGERLREARLAKGMTQEQLAEKAFTTRVVISAYELGLRGKKRPDVSMLLRVCGILGITISHLLIGNRINEY